MTAPDVRQVDRAPSRRVAGALWQAGVTRDSAGRRVTLNGEPLPLCFAAGKGWALCHPEPGLRRCTPTRKAPLGLAYLIDAFSSAVLLTGDVRIVPDASADEDGAWC